MKKTFLYQNHLENDAKIVNFSGWEMPLNYGSQIEEHKAVRNKVGMFDVSHMTVFQFEGKDKIEFLKKLLANDIGKINGKNKGLYSLILNHKAGIIDDVIAYHVENEFFLVSNCATYDNDKKWLESNAKSYEVNVKHRDDLGILAIQGPLSDKIVSKILDFNCKEMSTFDVQVINEVIVAKTGYTGELGFELIAPGDILIKFWKNMLKLNVTPIGLGARDTLRIEAGYCLYGTDMDESINPYECGLGWTVDMDDAQRSFIGKDSLQNIDIKKSRKLVGVILNQKGVLRTGYKLTDGDAKGEILSGSFSPILKKSIGFARTDPEFGLKGKVLIRNNALNVEIVSPRFIKKR